MELGYSMVNWNLVNLVLYSNELPHNDVLNLAAHFGAVCDTGTWLGYGPLVVGTELAFLESLERG